MSKTLSSALKQQATLYVLEALDTRETKAFEAILASNSAVKTYTNEIRESLHFTDIICQIKPDESYLENQRNLLRGRIEQLVREQKHSPFKRWWKSFKEALVFILIDAKQPAWAIAAYVMIAFFVGRWTFGNNDIQPGIPETAKSDNRLQEAIKQGQLGNTRLHLTGNKTTPVEFAFQTNEDITYSGDLDDQNVQQLIYYLLLNDKNAGNRIKAVQLVKELKPIEETELVLISSMLSDSNVGVRLKSARLLQNYKPSKLLLDACQKVLLEDDNEAIRQIALAIIGGHPDKDMIPALRVVGIMDDNVFIRNQAKAIIASLHDSDLDEEIKVVQ